MCRSRRAVEYPVLRRAGARMFVRPTLQPDPLRYPNPGAEHGTVCSGRSLTCITRTHDMAYLSHYSLRIRSIMLTYSLKLRELMRPRSCTGIPRARARERDRALQHVAGQSRRCEMWLMTVALLRWAHSPSPSRLLRPRVYSLDPSVWLAAFLEHPLPSIRLHWCD